MRGIDDHRGRAPDRFETPGGRYRHECMLDNVWCKRGMSEKGFCRSQGDGGVARLMSAFESERNVLVARGRGLKGDQLASDGCLTRDDVQRRAFHGEARPGDSGGFGYDLAGFLILFGRNDNAARLDDSHLLPGNFLDRMAQPTFVVHGDGKNDGDVGLNHICRIP